MPLSSAFSSSFGFSSVFSLVEKVVEPSIHGKLNSFKVTVMAKRDEEATAIIFGTLDEQKNVAIPKSDDYFCAFCPHFLRLTI